jgi:hypothetical protein
MPGGTVTFWPSHGVAVLAILNKEPDRTFGVGGYESSERSLATPAKWFKQTPDDTISLDCTLDDDVTNYARSVEQRLRDLRAMGTAREDRRRGGFMPPAVYLNGDVLTDDKIGGWLISTGGIALGPRLFNSGGTLVRQQVTVTLERSTLVGEIQAVRSTSTRTGKKHRRRRTRTVVVRTGDTLRAVALRELGDQGRWKDIKGWNKKLLKSVDPDARLRTGVHLSIKG